MKKISVFLVLITVLSVFTFITTEAAASAPKIVYEPAATCWYRPGETAQISTVAEGTDLHFSWLLQVSTPEKDYTFDLSKQAGFNGFAALDSSKKMTAKVETKSLSDGRMISVLSLQNLKFYDYGVYAQCTVANSAGSKTTDKVVLYPNSSAPAMPQVEQLAEINIRQGKLLKFACNVYAPEGQDYDNIEYQWLQTPDGSKDKAVKLEDENYSVLVVDTGIPGTYYYYCQFYILKGSVDYYYESSVAEINVYAPEINVKYSVSDLSLDAGQSAQIKANVTVDPSGDKGKLSYQWMAGDNNIPGTYTPVKGATSDTLTVTGADKAAKKYYCCLVTNEIDGFEFSNNSSEMDIVVVNSTGAKNPVVYMDPKDAYANVGDTVTFAVDASNAASYEWYMVKPGGTVENPNTPKKLKNGSDGVETGADSSILKIKASAEINGCVFYCQVYGLNGKYVSTKNATLTVHLPMPQQPGIKKHPESVSAYFGDKVTLSVTASSPDGGEIKYQWYVSDKPDYPLIRAVIGAEDKTFTPDQEDAEKYYCVAVWNVLNGEENGPVYSNFAKVELTDKNGGTVTEETASGSETAETPDTGLTGDETAAETETGEGLTTETDGTAADTAETVSDTSEVKTKGDSSKIVIILLVIIICLLAAALIGVIIFLIIKFVIKK